MVQQHDEWWSTFPENSLVRNDLLTKEELVARFSVYDYLVVAAMMLVSTLIGLFFWRRDRVRDGGSASLQTDEYLLGGRDMGTFPVTMSLIASFMSAITLLGTPAEIYVAGTQYIAVVLSYPLVMGATAYLYLPVYHKLDIATPYEYLGLRFGKTMRLLCSLCFTITIILYMAIVVYAPALALDQVIGIPVSVACAVSFAVCIIYTAVGGMKAVIWSDTFQIICMFGSFLIIVINGNEAAGGSDSILKLNADGKRLRLFNTDPDIRVRHTLWSMIIGGTFKWLSVFGTNQIQVQRYLSIKKKANAVKAIWWSGVGIASLQLLCAYGGLTMYAFYHDCDPLTMHQVSKKDQLFPLFVMQILGTKSGIPGLFVAGIYSAAMSTVSSGLNALASVWWRDCLTGVFKINIGEEKARNISKLLSVFFGSLGFSIAYSLHYFPGVLESALAILGITCGPVLGAFNLGMFFPFVSSKAALVGTITSTLLCMWFWVGQVLAKLYHTYDDTRWEQAQPASIAHCPANWTLDMIDIQVAEPTPPDDPPPLFHHLPIYDISYIWFAAISCLTCMAVGLLLMICLETKNHKKIDKRLISPTVESLINVLPNVISHRAKDYYDEIGSELTPATMAASYEIHVESNSSSGSENGSKGSTTGSINQISIETVEVSANQQGPNFESIGRSANVRERLSPIGAEAQSTKEQDIQQEDNTGLSARHSSRLSNQLHRVEVGSSKKYAPGFTDKDQDSKAETSGRSPLGDRQYYLGAVPDPTSASFSTVQHCEMSNAESSSTTPIARASCNSWAGSAAKKNKTQLDQRLRSKSVKNYFRRPKEALEANDKDSNSKQAQQSAESCSSQGHCQTSQPN